MTRSQRNLKTIGLTQFGPQVECAGYFQFSKATEFHYRLKLHHLILIETGRLDAVTSEGPLGANAHDLICFRPAKKMAYRVAPGTSFYQVAVQFSPEPRHLLTPELPEIGPLPVLTPTGGAFGEFQHLFEAICVDLPQAGSLHHFRMQSGIYRLLALLVSTTVASAPIPPRLDAWESIRLRVSSPEGGELSSDELAREIGVSRAHFLRIFKQRFGKNPTLCHMHARLGEAIRRLRETSESVKAISYSLGFNGAKGLRAGRLLARVGFGLREKVSRGTRGSGRPSRQIPQRRAPRPRRLPSRLQRAIDARLRNSRKGTQGLPERISRRRGKPAASQSRCGVPVAALRMLPDTT